jgi:DNA-binding FrmR family transcriptional regulator
VLQQLSAVRSALQNVSLIFARRYALQCMSDREPGLSEEQLIEQLLAVLSKV